MQEEAQVIKIPFYGRDLLQTNVPIFQNLVYLFKDRGPIHWNCKIFACASISSCHIPLSLNDPIVQWLRTLPFHGSNTGSNPVRVATHLNGHNALGIL